MRRELRSGVCEGTAFPGTKKAHRLRCALKVIEDQGRLVGAVGLGGLGLFGLGGAGRRGGFLVIAIGRLLELLDRLSKAASETWKLGATEEEEQDHEEDDQFRGAYAHEGERRVEDLAVHDFSRLCHLKGE